MIVRLVQKFLEKKNRTLIGKIRASHRGVTLTHLEKFAVYFNIDCNYFFRDGISFNYDTNEKSSSFEKSSYLITGENQINYGDYGRNIKVGKGTYNENNYRGTINKQIQNAKKIVNESQFPSKFQEQCSRILENIEQESSSLENLLAKQTIELKKMIELHNLEIKKQKEEIRKIKKERDEAREGERVALKKIVDFMK